MMQGLLKQDVLFCWKFLANNVFGQKVFHWIEGEGGWSTRLALGKVANITSDSKIWALTQNINCSIHHKIQLLDCAIPALLLSVTKKRTTSPLTVFLKHGHLDFPKLGHGSHDLSNLSVRKTMLRGPKGVQLDVRLRRGPETSSLEYFANKVEQDCELQILLASTSNWLIANRGGWLHFFNL